MSRAYFASILLFFILLITGCAKKKEEMQIFEPETLVTFEPITIVPSESISPSPLLSEEEQRIFHNRKIQEALKLAGYYDAEIDGKIGPKTRKAIREFQAAKGLTVDGIVGPKTWAELEKILTTQLPSAPSAPIK